MAIGINGLGRIGRLTLRAAMGGVARDAADPASGRPAGLPDLAKMAAQYLGRPASSAGVERMFSKAGKLHDDLKKRQVDDTLEHSLFAAANTR